MMWMLEEEETDRPERRVMLIFFLLLARTWLRNRILGQHAAPAVRGRRPGRRRRPVPGGEGERGRETRGERAGLPEPGPNADHAQKGLSLVGRPLLLLLVLAGNCFRSLAAYSSANACMSTVDSAKRVIGTENENLHRARDRPRRRQLASRVYCGARQKRKQGRSRKDSLQLPFCVVHGCRSEEAAAAITRRSWRRD